MRSGPTRGDLTLALDQHVEGAAASSGGPAFDVVLDSTTEPAAPARRTTRTFAPFVLLYAGWGAPVHNRRPRPLAVGNAPASPTHAPRDGRAPPHA
jgi:hypothetical protein